MGRVESHVHVGRHSSAWSTAAQAAILTLFLAVPSLADIYKYVPRYARLSPIAILVSFIVVFALLRYVHRSRAVVEVLASEWVTAALLCIMTLSSFVLFRHELARQNAGSGSTANQAMSDPVHALLAGQSLYHVHLSGNVPVSPGPAWILLNSPFTLVHAYWLLLPSWLIFTTLILRKVYRRPFEVNLGLAILLATPGVERLISEGHDALAIGCAVILVVVAADRLVHSDVAAVTVGAMAGVVATARIIYLLLPALIGLLLWSRSRRWAVVLSLSGVLLALVIHLAFSIGVHPYPPLHLFDRASRRQPTIIYAVGVVATATLVCLAAKYRQRNIASWMVWFAACFAVPHFFIGLGELESSRWAFATWEGANYILVGALPVLTAVLALHARQYPTLLRFNAPPYDLE